MRLQVKVGKERQDETDSIDYPLIVLAVAFPQTKQNGRDISRVFFQPPVVMHMPLAPHAGGVRGVVELIHDNSSQDVSNDTSGRIPVGCGGKELRGAMSGSRFLPCRFGKETCAREPVSFVSEDKRVSRGPNQPERVLILAGIGLERQFGFYLMGFGRAVVQKCAGSPVLTHIKLKIVRVCQRPTQHAKEGDKVGLASTVGADERPSGDEA